MGEIPVQVWLRKDLLVLQGERVKIAYILGLHVHVNWL